MSDTDTADSDSGIRFKTTSTRYKSDGPNHYSSSTKSKHSATSHGRHSRSRDNRGRERDRDYDSRHTNRRNRSSFSRSNSRSRSRDNLKRKRNKKRIQRSRSRSSSVTKKTYVSRERKSSIETKIVLESELETSMKQPNCNQTKSLADSVSSLSPQDEHTGNEESHAVCFGPILSPALLNKDSITQKNLVEEIFTGFQGPALPQVSSRNHPGESSISEKFPCTIGPALPDHLKASIESMESSESELSPFSEEEHIEDDLIGPMPGASNSKANLKLEQRALELKLKRLENPKNITITTREDWMLQLPDIRKVSDMGLGARQFRIREKLEIGDRSVWTDTPSDKERKKLGYVSSKDTTYKREEQERRKIAEYDDYQEEVIKKHKKHKRDKSLLDIHNKKAEKNKKKNNIKPIRRPFDRNIDLHANRFDDAQKKAIIKKAKLLDTRFSSGASKFL